ncbi:MAG TPA: trehalose-phosphatase [Rudaea sp.]|nr:trehalose-phosphatase [Rudaea sp.]
MSALPAEVLPRRDAPLPDAGARWALFLDVDGCLVEFAPSPEQVTIAPALLALLDGLRSGLGGALAIISGRTLDELDRMFAPLTFACAGQYGLVRRAADGSKHRAALPPAPAMESIRAACLALLPRFPGLKLEDKGTSIALHYRSTPEIGEAVTIAAAEIVAPFEGLYEVQPGAMVQEIKPATCSKGAALRAFWREPPFQGRQPVFVGDDHADESAFAAANALGGISVAVGVHRETRAGYHLQHPADARRWLGELLHALAGGA